MENYKAILELLDVILSDNPDSDTRTRINGVSSQMNRGIYAPRDSASHRQLEQILAVHRHVCITIPENWESLEEGLDWDWTGTGLELDWSFLAIQ